MLASGVWSGGSPWSGYTTSSLGGCSGSEGRRGMRFEAVYWELCVSKSVFFLQIQAIAVRKCGLRIQG